MKPMRLPNRLEQERNRIRAFEAREQTISYRADAWQRWIGSDTDLYAVIERFPASISRADLRRLSAEARTDDGAIRRLFIATMMWGFGTTTYGPYRTSRMLASNAIQQSRSGVSPIHDSYSLLVKGQTRSAYERLRVELCGPAYMSKFFYAAGLGWSLHPAPLVLDSQIAKALYALASAGEFDPATVVRTDANGFVQRFSDGYVRYLSLMAEWARHLDISAEALELYMFESASGRTNNIMDELPEGVPFALAALIGSWRGSCRQSNFRRGRPYPMEFYGDEIDERTNTFKGRLHWPDIQDTWSRVDGALAGNDVSWNEIDADSYGRRKGTEYYISGGSYGARMLSDGTLAGRWYNPETGMAADATFTLSRL